MVLISFCLQAPTFTIASNAGADGSLVLGKLLEQDDLNLGYDAAKGLCNLSVHVNRNYLNPYSECRSYSSLYFA